ncbi:MAG: efflux RND transporter periplasmic adaptor subunit [Nannocystaceae bacterium]
MIRRFFTVFLIPVLLVVIALAGAHRMIDSPDRVVSEPVPQPTPSVAVLVLSEQTLRPRIVGTGVIEPARQVTVVPEVAGRVVYQSPDFVIGGRVRAGDVLVRIEARNYKLVIRQQRNLVEQAKLALELEVGRGEVARREWELLAKEGGVRASPGRLASREPHRQAAEVGVDAAKSTLERARLDLRRTTIRAPFDATVIRESVEVGQVVGQGSVLATLVGTAEVWARVSLPVEDLASIELPGPRSQDLGAQVQLSQQLRGLSGPWTGRAARLVHELNVDSRTAQLLVAVARPFDPEPGQLPLLPGAFVRAEILGRPVAHAIAIPRAAVFEGRKIWRVDEDDRLRLHSLVPLWSEENVVYVSADSVLKLGTRVLLEAPPAAVEGMRVRPDGHAVPVPAGAATPGGEQPKQGTRG